MSNDSTSKPKSGAQPPAEGGSASGKQEAPSKKPQRTIKLPATGREVPVAYSRKNTRTGVIYDYVKREKKTTAYVLNPETGVQEKRIIVVTNYRKIGRSPLEAAKRSQSQSGDETIPVEE